MHGVLTHPISGFRRSKLTDVPYTVHSRAGTTNTVKFALSGRFLYRVYYQNIEINAIT